MMFKCFMKAVWFIVGLAVVAVAAEVLTDALSANCTRIGSATQNIRVREFRPES
jgi:hypothetical protein